MLPLEVITSAIFLFLSVYSVGSLMYECVYACFPWIIFYFITFWIFFVCRYRMSYYEHSVFNMHSMCLL